MPEAYPRKGDSYNALYLYKWAGLSEEGEPQIYDKDGKVTTTDYTDIEAIHYAGTSVPLYNGSFTNMLTYRNFDLSVQVLYAGGHKIRNSNIPDISMDYPVRVTNKDIRKRWRKVGDEATTDVPVCCFLILRIIITGGRVYTNMRISMLLMPLILRLITYP